MKLGVSITAVVLSLLGIAMLFGSGWEAPPMDSVQGGYRGVGMAQIYNPREVEADVAKNKVPPPPYPLEIPEDSPLAGEIYENVQVLHDVTDEEFNYIMAAMTEWVSPEQGCDYCHVTEEGFASDGIYTKVVARRMLQMTRHINTDWETHVGNVGVTCYTCHRGKNVPEYIWFSGDENAYASRMMGNNAGQNVPGAVPASASLPTDPLTPFLAGDEDIRVASLTDLPEGNRSSIKQTEWTYSLMMHMATSLGVNCTYCHNSRSFYDWEQSPPTRVTAWHGLEMTRYLNNEYMEPLGPQYPAVRLGPTGDAPKANCTTCHQGVYKPLYGANMLKDYPSLDMPLTAPPALGEQVDDDQQARLDLD